MSSHVRGASMSIDTPTSRAYSDSVVSQWSGKMQGLSFGLLNPELPDGELLDKWMAAAGEIHYNMNMRGNSYAPNVHSHLCMYVYRLIILFT
jgi:hypothetical protein